MNSCFLIHRKSFLIKASNKTFCSLSFFEYLFPNHGKINYDYTVNELGCPRSGLLASNARSSFKPLYVFLKHWMFDNKVPEQTWGHLTL